MRGILGGLVVAISLSGSIACYLPEPPESTDIPTTIVGQAKGDRTTTKVSAPSSSTDSSSASYKSSSSTSDIGSNPPGKQASSATLTASPGTESIAVTSVLDSQIDPFYPKGYANGPPIVTTKDGAVIVNASVPDDAGPNIPPGFVSFSLDDNALLAYLGESGKPNTLSVNLLQNLGDKMGVMPVWRIIGDSLVFDMNQKEPLVTRKAPDGKNPVMGPVWFESFANFPNTKYIMGLNFFWTGPAAEKSRLDTITALCQKLQPNMIERWEMGNEPDLYPDNGARSTSYNVQDHAKEYVDATNAARARIATACPGFPNSFMGTSIIGTDGSQFHPVKSFEFGINDKNAISLIGTHSYMAFEGTPKATLANLMNHKVISDLIFSHSKIGLHCAEKGIKIPYILGETNSIAGGGAKGISDVFGAALYTVDFSLRGAASGILRMHTHTGSGASYNAWEPGWGTVDHPTYVGAPYYGHIFVAEILGSKATRVVEIGLPGNFNNAAYAVYENDKIARIAIINFEGVSHQYRFHIGGAAAGSDLKVSILDAPDKSSKTGITFDGYSYTPESDGRSVHSNPAGSTTVQVDSRGDISIPVKGVQAVMIHVA